MAPSSEGRVAKVGRLRFAIVGLSLLFVACCPSWCSRCKKPPDHPPTIAVDQCGNPSGPTLKFRLTNGTPRAEVFDGGLGSASCVVDRVCSDTADIHLPVGASWGVDCLRRKLAAYAPGSGPRLLNGGPFPPDAIELPPPAPLPVHVWILPDNTVDASRLARIEGAVAEQLASAETAYLDLGAGFQLEYNPSSVVITDAELQSLIGNGCHRQWDLAATGAEKGVYDGAGINIYVVSRIATGEPDGKNCRDYTDAAVGKPHPEIIYLAYDRYTEDGVEPNWWSTEVIAHEMGHALGPMEGWWDHIDGFAGFDAAYNLMNGAGPPEVKEITLGQIFRMQFVGSALAPRLAGRTDLSGSCGDGPPGTHVPAEWCPAAAVKPVPPWP